MKKIFACLLFICLITTNTVFAQNISPVSLIKPYKDISAKLLAIRKLNKQANNLSEDDKGVISKYVYGAVQGENTFLLMNGYLRGNLNQYIKQKDITKPLQMRMKYYADNLSKTLSKTLLPQNIILYRNVDKKELSAFFTDKKIIYALNKPAIEDNLLFLQSELKNKTFFDKGFAIAYYDKDCLKHNTNLIFEIKAPKDMQGVVLLNNDYKKAIILNKDTKWKVTAVSVLYDKDQQRNIYKITLNYCL